MFKKPFNLNKLSIAMMVFYPLVAFTSLSLNHPLFIIGYLLLILFVISLDKFLERHWLSASLLFISIAFILYITQQVEFQYLLFLPPLLIIFSLFVLFSQSLVAGNTPLISLYAKLLGDKLEERHLRYNRKLTILWSVFFFAMGISSILLALFASFDNWSLFTHVISYLLVALFFVIEFMYRKHHFAGEVEGGFFQFIVKIIKIRPTNL